MANQNLSEFGEKLFVADADHTFIWDSAASISKRVSRNSWLNSGTLTSDAPVTISQTWNGTGSTVFTALKVNATTPGTTSSASSLLLDLQVGGVSTASINKSGQFYAGSTTQLLSLIQSDAYIRNASSGRAASLWADECRIVGGPLVFSDSINVNISTISAGVALYKEAPNTLALRNSTSAQTFNVYGTYTSGTSYERLTLSAPSAANAIIGTNKGSGGGTARGLDLHTDGTARMTITTAGNVGIGTTAPLAKLQVNTNNNGLNIVSVFYNENNTPTGGNAVGFAFMNESGNVTHYKASIVHERTSTWARGKLHFLLNNIEGGAATSLADARMTIQPDGNVGIGTTSPSSKLHVVGDAVLTGQLLGGDYTVGTLTASPQPCVSFTNNHAAFVDSSIVITPKGTGGVIFGPKPDGTTTGGNARGARGIDHQISRNAATQVASGTDALICGGNNNTASNQLSIVVGGASNNSSGYISFIGGGQLNTSSSNYSTVAGGNSNTASNTWSTVSGGQSNTASATHSVVCGGANNTASTDYAFVSGGRNASANRYALNAHSAGQFSQVGDAQKTTAVFRNKTTTNSAVELFLDGALQRYTITSGKIISMLINITGTKSDGSAVAHYVRQYSIKNIGGTTSQVYAAVTVGTDNAAGTSIAISADDTNDSLKIEVTGVAAETWRWVASVDAVEVGHGV